jgi:hypothetical protein
MLIFFATIFLNSSQNNHIKWMEFISFISSFLTIKKLIYCPSSHSWLMINPEKQVAYSEDLRALYYSPSTQRI